jgi:hypothetical protein
LYEGQLKWLFQPHKAFGVLVVVIKLVPLIAELD